MYAEVQGDNTVVSVETAIAYANTHNSAGAVVPAASNIFHPANVVFVAGPSDGYLLVDANNTGVFVPGPPNVTTQSFWTTSTVQLSSDHRTSSNGRHSA